MNGTNQLDSGACGCCTGVTIATPREVWNRPGLSAIGYRIGAHADFSETLRARLSAVEFERLAALKTRDESDYAVALLDACALLCDVLTFYQERIANEGYLRTATERVSVQHLGELIGYALRPGVAAGADLAFTMENAPGAPPTTVVAAGTRIQSIPGPDERPQVFETIADLDARPEWNAIRPRSTQPQPLSVSSDLFIVQGTATGLQAGDTVLIVEDTVGAQRAIKRVVRVVPDTRSQTTRVELALDPPDPPLFFLIALPLASFTPTMMTLTTNTVESIVVNKSWKQSDLTAFAKIQAWPIPALTLNVSHQIFLRIQPRNAGLFAFRKRAAIFGHNAPKHSSLSADQQKVTANVDTRTLASDDALARKQVFLDAPYAGIGVGGWAVLETPSTQQSYRVEDVAEQSRAEYGISGRCTRLRLDSRSNFESFGIRDTTVHAQSERLPLADLPIANDVAGSELVLDGLYLGLEVGRRVALTGERADLAGVVMSEVLTIAEAEAVGGYTVLRFQSGLQHTYRRTTVTVNANLAPSTHGERVVEVVGSGDATQPFQTFVLRQPPLTHVSAANPRGSQSTLEIRVDGVKWAEVENFLGQPPDATVYTTVMQDNGATVVQFGDGRTGARLPTGRENVQAIYRKGMGEEGLVDAHQLTLLLTKPLGVRGVTNPLPASGAADRETLDGARENAPRHVLTLGRVVSVRDYEDFARAFSGIGKALATWSWDGRRRVIYLTVAGPDGAAIADGSPTHTNLVTALREAGDPRTFVRVRTYRDAFFRTSATVTVAPAWRPADVIANVTGELRRRFSFAARAFGQSVMLSEVIAAIHGVAGVVAVDVDTLYRTDGDVGLETALPAFAPAAGDADTRPAELLTLDPRPIALGVAP